MSNKGGYSYYDYVKNYDSKFLNKYQSNNHWYAGRGTNFLEILRLKAVRLKSNRNWMWFDMRFGSKFLYIFYMPQLFFLTGSYLLTPAFRRLDERYHLRYSEGEIDEICETEPFVTYQQRKKPVTRRKYTDAVKLIYNENEEYDFVPDQPQRYR